MKIKSKSDATSNDTPAAYVTISVKLSVKRDIIDRVGGKDVAEKAAITASRNHLYNRAGFMGDDHPGWTKKNKLLEIIQAMGKGTIPEFIEAFEEKFDETLPLNTAVSYTLKLNKAGDIERMSHGVYQAVRKTQTRN